MSIAGKTVGILTLGCRVNQYESQAICELLEAHGVTVLFAPSAPCDAYLVHTCAVTAESSRKSRQLLRRVLRKAPNAAVVVTGCEAERAAESLAAILGVDAVVGNRSKTRCAEILLDLLANGKYKTPLRSVPSLADAEFEPMHITRSERTRAYVKIEDGCNGKCAYCIIATLRGPVRSRPIADTVAEVKRLVSKGYKEIVLTGIETSAYAYGLPTLLATLHEIPGLERIRLSSMDPAAITEDFVKAVAALPKVMPHYHLSLQSGCSATLARMRRRYTAEQAKIAVERLATSIAGLSLTADVIVGFPGESEAEFAKTYAFLSALPLHHIHIFPFSPRPGTPAATLADQVPDTCKTQRLQQLEALVARRFAEIGQTFVGKTVRVLFETVSGGIGHGHAENMIEVHAPLACHQTGCILPVCITDVKDGYLVGTILREEV